MSVSACVCVRACACVCVCVLGKGGEGDLKVFDSTTQKKKRYRERVKQSHALGRCPGNDTRVVVKGVLVARLLSAHTHTSTRIVIPSTCSVSFARESDACDASTITTSAHAVIGKARL